MKTSAFKVWCKAQFEKQRIKDGFDSIKNRLVSEEGGADGIIIAIIIIIIVVGLAFLFREQIFGWFNDLSDQASSEINQNWGHPSGNS